MRGGNNVRAAVSGILAVAAGVSVGELVALPISPYASPYQAVAAFLVDFAPAFAREWAIDTFGTADKPALMVGVGASLLVLAVIAGVLQTRRPPWGVAVVVLFAGVGVIAAVTRPTMQPSYLLPPLVAGLVAAAVLVVMCRGARTTASDGQWSRRQFLVASGLVAAASAGTALVARQISRAGDVLAERRGLTLPEPTTAADPIPPGADLRVDGSTPFLTDNADFYRIDTALQVPRLSTQDWQLRIHGMVDEELTLRWDDLIAMDSIEQVITLTCVSNEVGGDLAGNARWIGVPMRAILDRVGVRDDADMLLSTSVDGWTSGTPLSAVTDGRDAILAFGMNGEALPLEHGYPVRQVIPGLYGYVSACKWVVDWEITRFDRAQAYWTERGWGVRAPIKTASRIDRPAPLSVQPAGKVVVAGTAWAQHRGISAVEVRVDDGPWQPARLADQYSIDTWRLWSFDWDATPGQHTLYCRATDGAGRVQPEQRVAPIPDGATGWHSRVLRVDG
ncbi:molybdopterin-dependent oxidoreductase [Gordonia sp. PKS22-38]|uniref:Molybdopterin-dependent oxidoreductase n=1 Tax=Gordonia prachuapensis TaxID=3115651 RepID=A0ABU7N0E2_9ACTN|nr:molybdopterin-dependent oxidoreductase [Gordonia sp. PKS22-38]